MTEISVFPHHGTKPWDFGISELERPSDNSLAIKKKFSQSVFPPITDKLFPQEPIMRLSFGTPSLIANTPVTQITIKTGLARSDIHHCCKKQVPNRISNLISHQLDGTDVSKFGIQISKLETLSNPTKTKSTLSQFHLTPNIWPLEVKTKCYTFGM